MLVTVSSHVFVIRHSRELEEGNLDQGSSGALFPWTRSDASRFGAVVKIVIATVGNDASDIIGLVEDSKASGRQVRTQESARSCAPPSPKKNLG